MKKVRVIFLTLFIFIILVFLTFYLTQQYKGSNSCKNDEYCLIEPTKTGKYNDEKHGIHISFLKDWRYSDDSDYFKAQQSTIYKRVTITSPDNDAYYTGGDFGRIVWNHGHQIRLVLDTSRFYNTTEDKCEDIFSKTINNINYSFCKYNNTRYTVTSLVNVRGVDGISQLVIYCVSGKEENDTSKVLSEFLNGLSLSN